MCPKNDLLVMLLVCAELEICNMST